MYLLIAEWPCAAAVRRTFWHQCIRRAKWWRTTWFSGKRGFRLLGGAWMHALLSTHGITCPFLFHKVCWVLVLGMDLWRIGSNSTRGLLVSSFWDSVVDSDTGKNWAWKVSRKITEMRSEEKVSSLGFFQYCDSFGLYVFQRVQKHHVTMTDVERSPVCF